MQDSDISGLVPVSTPVGSDVFASVNGGTTKRMSLTQALNFVNLDYAATFFVGKSGSDSNDGKSINKPFLTINKAVTEAKALTPSSTNIISIQILDAGIYTEDIAMGEWINLLGGNANIVGEFKPDDNSSVFINSLENLNAAEYVISADITDESNVYVTHMSIGASTVGVLKLGLGTLNLHVGQTLNANGTLFDLDLGTLNVTGQNLRATTFCDVATGTSLHVLAAKTAGTRTINASATSVSIISGNEDSRLAEGLLVEGDINVDNIRNNVADISLLPDAGFDIRAIASSTGAIELLTSAGNIDITSQTSGLINLSTALAGTNITINSGAVTQIAGATNVLIQGVSISGADAITDVSSLDVGLMNLATNTIASTGLNNNLVLAGNGTGYVVAGDALSVGAGVAPPTAGLIVDGDIKASSDILTNTIRDNGSDISILPAINNDIRATTSGTGRIELTTSAGNIDLASQSSGEINLSTVLAGTDITVSAGDNAQISGSNVVQVQGVVFSNTSQVSGIAQLDVDNLRIDGNTLSATNIAGEIHITPASGGNAEISNNLVVGTGIITSTSGIAAGKTSLLSDVLLESNDGIASFDDSNIFITSIHGSATHGGPVIMFGTDVEVDRFLKIGAFDARNSFLSDSGRDISINGSNAYFSPSQTGANAVSAVDIDGNLTVGPTYAATNVAPTGGALFEGDVGIGVTSPSEKLHVDGNLILDGTAGTYNYRVSITTEDNAGPLLEFGTTSTPNAYMEWGTFSSANRWENKNRATKIYDCSTLALFSDVAPLGDVSIGGSIAVGSTFDSTVTPETNGVSIEGKTCIGTGTTAGFLTVDQNSATGAVPVLTLDQGDVSEPFINYVGTATAGTNSSISTLNTSGATTDHIQIDLNGTKAWIAVSTNDPT